MSTEKDTVRVGTQRCIVCGRSGEVRVPAQGFRLWKLGSHIQEAFPDLDAEVREQLTSGTHPRCWNTLYGVTEEDGDESD